MIKNGTKKLRYRFFIFPTTLFGIRKWGLQQVWLQYHKDYANYEEPDWNCWTAYCWEEQIEKLI